MNKFSIWMENNDKKQRGTAKKLSISTATLHNILRKGLMPSLKLAYEIEKYTKGAITLYDWVDELNSQNSNIKQPTTQNSEKHN